MEMAGEFANQAGPVVADGGEDELGHKGLLGMGAV
jgi:hypothetical protein